ncbi:MAG TPA: ATP-dependent DNA helicase RecQ [Planctomycetota bacterium]|nr:ATP-dependent DNA helicase RecQ [Planctomycetota bacterium]
MDPLLDVVKKYWDYDALRPLQREAMTAAVEGKDSLVVLPTGGGKSLCYQAPALLSDKLTIVVSPLISLMKDQVDRLLSRGVEAAFINSSLESSDKSRVQAGIARGQYKLIFVAPERFAAGGFDRVLRMGRVGAFAIDEAHCISHWGHDFRVDYREMGRLKKEFPEASVHAFTATATPRVRDDIVEQLGLKDPQVLVGDFFRPNLNYRAIKRGDAEEDIVEEVKKRAGQAGIVYCIRRADVDDIARRLKREKVKAAPYHAGMDDEDRTRTQDRFAAGEVDVVVATVAFGMGIDRSDIRYVLHAAMPKSMEHYQQETGRAGRDGKPADCILYHSGQDYQMWHSIIAKNETGDLDTKLKMLSEMYNYATSARCRHRRLVQYFGQSWERDKCDACDVCNGGLGSLPDSTELARTLLTGVIRTNQRYGPAYVAEVLAGERTDRVVERGHDALDVFGLMPGKPKNILISWLHQLHDQGALRVEGEYGVLRLTPLGANILKGVQPAALYGTAPSKSGGGKRAKKAEESKTVSDEGTPLDADGKQLFEQLRGLRREISDENGVPAFMVFSDKTLRAMARQRPTTKGEMLRVHGIGFAKLESFGDRFMKAIRDFRA